MTTVSTPCCKVSLWNAMSVHVISQQLQYHTISHRTRACSHKTCTRMRCLMINEHSGSLYSMRTCCSEEISFTGRTKDAFTPDTCSRIQVSRTSNLYPSTCRRIQVLSSVLFADTSGCKWIQLVSGLHH